MRETAAERAGRPRNAPVPGPFRGAPIASALLGIDGRRTAVVLRALGAMCGLTLVGASARSALAADRLHAYASAIDHLTSGLILLGLLASVVGPFAYAAWNGGPALAFLIALVPEVTAELFARRWVLDLDLAVALTAGAGGAAVALAVTALRADDGRWYRTIPPRTQTLPVCLLTAGAAGAVGRFASQAPASVLAAYRPFALLWTIPIAVAASFVVARRRNAD